MIGQEIALPYLIPLAIDVLQQEPLAEGDFYRGDLLASVIRSASWLRNQPSLLARMVSIVERGLADLGGTDAELGSQMIDFLACFRTVK